MSPLATVLYEDRMLPNSQGQFPLHELALRMVEDDINGETWKLHQVDIRKNPMKGVGNVLRNIRRTKRLAGNGIVIALIDADRLHDHFDVARDATDEQRVVAIKAKSDAPERLYPFFLQDNMEALLRDIRACDASLLPEVMDAALQKSLNDRDVVLREVAKQSNTSVRSCVRRDENQPGLDKMVRLLGELIRNNVHGWPNPQRER